jgi:hypothetical protein
MLRNIEFLQGSTVKASDGDVGTVTQVYFDDEAWGVRYLVVETGDWLRDRQVLISPYAVSHSDPGSSDVHVKLTRQQVRDSPNIDAHKPVSRQHEIQYLKYYGYPTYWGGANVWGMVPIRPSTVSLRRPRCHWALSLWSTRTPTSRRLTSVCVARKG